MELKTCPKCGNQFECRHDASCWCVKITLSDVVKEELKNNYADCLCKTCLTEFEGNSKKNLAK